MVSYFWKVVAYRNQTSTDK